MKEWYKTVYLILQRFNIRYLLTLLVLKISFKSDIPFGRSIIDIEGMCNSFFKFVEKVMY